MVFAKCHMRTQPYSWQVESHVRLSQFFHDRRCPHFTICLTYCELYCSNYYRENPGHELLPQSIPDEFVSHTVKRLLWFPALRFSGLSYDVVRFCCFFFSVANRWDCSKCRKCLWKQRNLLELFMTFVHVQSVDKQSTTLSIGATEVFDILFGWVSAFDKSIKIVTCFSPFWVSSLS